MEISEHHIREQGYLISRGVRPLALIGTCDADSLSMLSIYNKLEFMQFGRSAGLCANTAGGETKRWRLRRLWVCTESVGSRDIPVVEWKRPSASPTPPTRVDVRLFGGRDCHP